MIKLAFAGKKQSGKTTLSDYCNEIYGLEPVSFADQLKMDLMEIGINHERLFGVRDDNSRALMQALGAAMRDQDEDYWLNLVLDLVHSDLRYVDGIVIDDLRYLNEAKALKKEGFTLIKVIRHGYDHPEDKHQSENGLTNYPFDYVISASDGNYDSLYEQMDDIMNTLEGE